MIYDGFLVGRNGVEKRNGDNAVQTPGESSDILPIILFSNKIIELVTGYQCSQRGIKAKVVGCVWTVSIR